MERCYYPYARGAEHAVKPCKGWSLKERPPGQSCVQKACIYCENPSTDSRRE